MGNQRQFELGVIDFSTFPPSLSESFFCNMLKCEGARNEEVYEECFVYKGKCIYLETLQRSNRKGANSFFFSAVLPRPVQTPKKDILSGITNLEEPNFYSCYFRRR